VGECLENLWYHIFKFLSGIRVRACGERDCGGGEWGGFSLPSFFKFGGRKRSGGSISVGLMQGWVRMEP